MFHVEDFRRTVCREVLLRQVRSLPIPLSHVDLHERGQANRLHLGRYRLKWGRDIRARLVPKMDLSTLYQRYIGLCTSWHLFLLWSWWCWQVCFWRWVERLVKKPKSSPSNGYQRSLWVSFGSCSYPLCSRRLLRSSLIKNALYTYWLAAVRAFFVYTSRLIPAANMMRESMCHMVIQSQTIYPIWRSGSLKNSTKKRKNEYRRRKEALTTPGLEFLLLISRRITKRAIHSRKASNSGVGKYDSSPTTTAQNHE